MKMSLQETRPVKSRGFSLRSMLLLALLVGVGAGATGYVLGNAFAAITGTPSTGANQAERNDYVREHFYGRTQLHSNISVEFVDDGQFKPHFSLELHRALLGYSGPVLRSFHAIAKDGLSTSQVRHF